MRRRRRRRRRRKIYKHLRRKSILTWRAVRRFPVISRVTKSVHVSIVAYMYMYTFNS